MKRLVFSAFLALAACGKETADVAVTPAPPARRAVAAEAVARLEQQLATTEPTAAPVAELGEQVDGLLATLGGTDESMRRVARDELASLGVAATPLLAAALERTDLSQAARLGAAEALAKHDNVDSARALLARVMLARRQADPEPWMRAQCAWRLSQTTQDWCVPSLILALRYETDYETVMWTARTLAHFGNFAGLDALRVIANSNTESAPRAVVSSNELASEAGFNDALALESAWIAGDERLQGREWSPRRELETWRLIAGFSQWQLRGVDDARFVLSREGLHCAGLLAQALADGNRYVRTHAAQCLERMGRRARVAGPALLAALDDPELALQAMLALGAVGHAPAEAELVARLHESHALETRLTAARALGSLRQATAVPHLAPLLDSKQPYELRIAAACSLAALAPLELERATVELLIGALTGGRVESLGPETALGIWLAARAERYRSPRHIAIDSSGRRIDGGPLDTLDEWRAAGSASPGERVAVRAALLSAQLDALFAL